VNYYERHIGDYLKDTAHLSLLEHGIYSRLLDIYYSRDGAVPADQVMRLVGARTDAERSAVRDVINEFFDVDGDVLRHNRCDREIAKYQDKQRKAAASANARWSNTHQHSEGNANAMRTHSEGNAPNPNPNPNKEKTARKRAAPAGASCPDSVSEDVWRDWTALRKAKRAPVSPTVLAEAEREAVKAGMTLDAFLRLWCARGSQGLQAEWLKPHEVGSVPISANSRALKRETDEFMAQQRERDKVLSDPAEQAKIAALIASRRPRLSA
jgi:uncharacterized protein YdaU (DUF1376 family)